MGSLVLGLALTLFSFPYTLLPVRAAIQGVDRSLEEASRGLGKSGIGTFFRVTLPQLRPAIMAGSLLVALYTLSDFGAVSILRFDALTRIIFLQYTTSLDRGGAAALALLLVGLAIIVVVIEGMSRGRSRYYTSASHRKAEPVSLGRWRWPATFFCGSIVAFALILPASVILFWLVRGVAGGRVPFIHPRCDSQLRRRIVLGGGSSGRGLVPHRLLGCKAAGHRQRRSRESFIYRLRSAGCYNSSRSGILCFKLCIVHLSDSGYTDIRLCHTLSATGSGCR